MSNLYRDLYGDLVMLRKYHEASRSKPRRWPWWVAGLALYALAYWVLA